MPNDIRYNVALMQEDLAARGLQPVDLARAMGVAASTVTRFLKGQHQTAKTAHRIAVALGFSTPRRYVVRATDIAAKEITHV